MKLMPIVMVFLYFLCTRIIESDGGSSQSLGVVLGGAFGGVVAVLAVTVMAVMIWRVKVYRRKETGSFINNYCSLQTAGIHSLINNITHISRHCGNQDAFRLGRSLHT